jgi:hypothetical protein
LLIIKFTAFQEPLKRNRKLYFVGAKTQDLCEEIVTKYSRENLLSTLADGCPGLQHPLHADEWKYYSEHIGKLLDTQSNETWVVGENRLRKFLSPLVLSTQMPKKKMTKRKTLESRIEKDWKKTRE